MGVDDTTIRLSARMSWQNALNQVKSCAGSLAAAATFACRSVEHRAFDKPSNAQVRSYLQLAAVFSDPLVYGIREWLLV